MADTAAAATPATAPAAPAVTAATDAAPAPGKPTKVYYTSKADEPVAPASTSRQDRLTKIREAAATVKADTPAAEKPADKPADAPVKEPEAKKPEAKTEKSPEIGPILRAEKRLREQAKALQESTAKLEADRAAYTARAAKAEALLSKLDSEDPYTVLDEITRVTGKKFDVNEWARRQIRQGTPQGSDEALSRVEKLEKAAAEKEAAAKVEAERANYEQVRTKVIAEVDQLVQNQGEKYELIRTQKAVPAVFELIADNFKQTGRLLSYDEACDAVEAHLEQVAASWVTSDKVKKKFGAPPASASEEAPSSDQRSTKPPTPERKPNATTTPDRVPSSRKERFAAAVAILSAPPPKR